MIRRILTWAGWKWNMLRMQHITDRLNMLKSEANAHMAEAEALTQEMEARGVKARELLKAWHDGAPT